MNLTKAHNELFRRTPDEAFAIVAVSLGALPSAEDPINGPMDCSPRGVGPGIGGYSHDEPRHGRRILDE